MGGLRAGAALPAWGAAFACVGAETARATGGPRGTPPSGTSAEIDYAVGQTHP